MLIESTTYELFHFANDSMHFGYDLIDGIINLSKKQNTYLYPNPANDELHLSISNSTFTNTQLIITDILGQQVYSAPITKSETTHNIIVLASGIYNWHLIENSNTIKTGKLIKQ